MVLLSDDESKKKIVDESQKTRKAREKLQKKLEALDKKITPQAIEKKAVEIHRWIARHASSRIPLRTKGISLFDENQNAAELSRRVVVFAKQFQTEQEDNIREQFSKFKKLIQQD